MPARRLRDVVVLIPGLTGSVLRRDGKDVWGPSAGALIGAALSRGGRFGPLVLREDPVDRDDLGDGVAATRLFPDVHMVPGLWKIDGYSKLAATLRTGLGLVPGRNLFEFPYDWRRDVRVAGRLLARRAHEWLSRWREQSGHAEARIVLVAHSMGGLVARVFLELHDGWRTTRALVAFGTPFRGSPGALDALVNGSRKGPLGLVELTALARSCTSVHQLLPVYPMVDRGDGRLVRVADASIPGLDPARVRAAREVHDEIRAAVESHRRSVTYRERGYTVFPVVGLGQPTAQSARLVDGRVEMLETLDGEELSGDGTVPRVSATPLERGRERREVFVGTRHATLQSGGSVLAHVVGLLGGFAIDLDAYRRSRARLLRVALETSDVYWSDEPVTVRARVHREGGRPAPREAARLVDARTGPAHRDATRPAERDGLRLGDRDGVRLVARVRPALGGPPVARVSLHRDASGVHTAEIPPLPPGSFRVSLAGGRSVEPAEDVFVVVRDRRP